MKSNSRLPTLRTRSRAEHAPTKRRKRLRALPVAPTLLTLAGAACGFGAITLAAKGGDPATSPHYITAGLLIFAAILFDALDGKVARLTNQTSEFGKQLDSLCDAISFGVAPAFLAVKCAAHYHPRFLWMIALLYMLCAILRLARFNVEAGKVVKGSFSGLPSPAAAGAVASIVVAMPELHRLGSVDLPEFQQRLVQWMSWSVEMGLPVLVLATACLMVSRVRYPYFATQILTGRLRFPSVVKLVFAIVAVVSFHELAAPLIFCYYVFESPLRTLWQEAALGPIQKRLGASTE